MRSHRQLTDAVAWIARHAGQASVVEALVAGRDIEVAVLGNSPPWCLPPVELLPDGTEGKACPAVLDASLASAVRACAVAAYRACACRDYALVRLRLTPKGLPVVTEVGTANVLEPGGSFELAAAAAGLSYADLLSGIVTIACERYRLDVAMAQNAAMPASRDRSGSEPGIVPVRD